MSGDGWASRSVQRSGSSDRITLPQDIIDEEVERIELKAFGDYLIGRPENYDRSTIKEEGGYLVIYGEDEETLTLTYSGSKRLEDMKSALLEAIASGADYLQFFPDEEIEGETETALKSDLSDRGWLLRYDDEKGVFEIPEIEHEFSNNVAGFKEYTDTVISNLDRHLNTALKHERDDEEILNSIDQRLHRSDYQWAFLQRSLYANPMSALEDLEDRIKDGRAGRLSDELRETLYTANQFVHNVYDIKEGFAESDEALSTIGESIDAERLGSELRETAMEAYSGVQLDIEEKRKDSAERKGEFNEGIESLIGEYGQERGITREFAMLQRLGEEILETPSTLARLNLDLDTLDLKIKRGEIRTRQRHR